MLLFPWLDHDDSRFRVHLDGQAAGFEGGDDGGIGAGGEDILMSLGQLADDSDDLSRSLALAEHCLGDAVTEGAMEIHAREAQVVDRHVAQPCQRQLRRERARGHGLEELLYLFAIHLSASFALPLRNPWRSRVT